MGEESGQGSGLLPEVLVSLVIVSLVAAIWLIFIFKASSGAALYEQTYAKQIALLLDNAKTGMTFVVDVSKGVEISKKSGKGQAEIVSINSDKNELVVSLSSGKGYRVTYFSDVSVSSRIDRNSLILNVGARENE